MRLMCLWAVARKEGIHILRDWRSLTTSILLPVFLIILFGFALKFDVENVPLVVWDQSRTPASRELIGHFSGSSYFSVGERYADNYREIEKALDNNDALIGLIIPANFGSALNGGKGANIQAIVDGSDSNKATIALGYVDQLVNRYSQQLLLEKIERKGSVRVSPPIDLDLRVWYNPEMDTRYSIIPSLIPMIMMVVGATLTSLVIVREREIGTMEQLISTPVKINEIILGKMLPYFFIGMLDMLFIVMISEFGFDIPLRGSLTLVFVMAAIFLVDSLLLGMVISIVSKTQLVAIQLAMVLTFLPSVLLSGFTAPIYNMPIVVQWISAFVPARYYITILRAIYEKGVGLETIYIEAAILVIFAVVLMIAAQTLLRKKLV